MPLGKFSWTILSNLVRRRGVLASSSNEGRAPRFDSPDYWGSTEEHEIQSILQEIIASSLDPKKNKKTLIRLFTYLQTASDGWVDRFSACQGVLVLKKLLYDINSSDSYMQLSELNEYPTDLMERELEIVKCLNVVLGRSSVARELATEDKRQSLVSTLLRSALSPNKETRSIVSDTLIIVGSTHCPSNSLQLLTLFRRPSSRKLEPEVEPEPEPEPCASKSIEPLKGSFVANSVCHEDEIVDVSLKKNPSETYRTMEECSEDQSYNFEAAIKLLSI